MSSLSRPASMIARAARAAATFSLGAAMAVAASVSAFAQGVPVVRDAEIEALVRDYARPIFKAAGLSNAGIQIVLVNDPSFNAFVAGRRLFINTGALLQAETPNEIIGVIAHECGHLAGGHQQKLRDQLERAKTMAIVAGLLGAGALAAGAASNNRGLAGAGMGLATGGGEFARRSLLSYQRGEEITADRSAVTYLNSTGQSGKGMLKTFERFQSALSLSGAQVAACPGAGAIAVEAVSCRDRAARVASIGNARCRNSAGRHGVEEGLAALDDRVGHHAVGVYVQAVVPDGFENHRTDIVDAHALLEKPGHLRSSLRRAPCLLL